MFNVYAEIWAVTQLIHLITYIDSQTIYPLIKQFLVNVKTIKAKISTCLNNCLVYSNKQGNQSVHLSLRAEWIYLILCIASTVHHFKTCKKAK